MRLEVRVCQDGEGWEVRVAGERLAEAFDSQWEALRHARDIARLKWIDEGRMASVQVRTAQGTCESDTLYGGESGS